MNAQIRDSDEQSLLAAAQAGDRAAIQELLGRFVPVAQRVAMRIMHDTDACNDVVQNAMVRVLKTIGAFRGESSVETWMYRVTVNEALQALRKAKRFELFDPELVAHEGPDALAQAQRREEARAVRAALLKLPGRYREALAMYYYGERSVREIAQALKSSESAVKVVLFKARKRLADELGPERMGTDEAV